MSDNQLDAASIPGMRRPGPAVSIRQTGARWLWLLTPLL